MSKLSETFRPTGGGALTVRLVLMAVILLLLLGALIAVRSGLMSRVMAPPAEETPAPVAPAPDTHPIHARVNADNDSVQLSMRQAGGEVAPPVVEQPAPVRPAPVPLDETPPAAASTDNDVFADVLDGHQITSRERAAYDRIAAMAWDLGQTPAVEPALRLKRLELMASPKQYRGRLVRVQGSLLRVRPEQFDNDLARPDRPRQYYECAVKSAEEDLFIVLVYQNPLDNAIRPMRDVVWTDAWFFKVWGYNDGKMQAPLLMGHRLHKLVIEDSLGPTAAVTLIGFAALVTLIVLWLRLGRRRSDRLRQRLAREDAEDIEIPEPKALPRDEPPE